MLPLPTLDELFLSTPSARRATLFVAYSEHFQLISIHALREEGDHARVEQAQAGFIISIHALREEGDVESGEITADDYKFLSTPSARRATVPLFLVLFWQRISIHALREEGDTPLWTT